MAGRSRRERACEKPGARERKRSRGKKRARVVERIREREIHTVRESRPELARRPLASDPIRPVRRPATAPGAPVRPLLAGPPPVVTFSLPLVPPLGNPKVR